MGTKEEEKSYRMNHLKWEQKIERRGQKQKMVSFTDIQKMEDRSEYGKWVDELKRDNWKEENISFK
jgi:hypothetical protein